MFCENYFAWLPRSVVTPVHTHTVFCLVGVVDPFCLSRTTAVCCNDRTPLSTEVKNTWRLTSSRAIGLYGVVINSVHDKILHLIFLSSVYFLFPHSSCRVIILSFQLYFFPSLCLTCQSFLLYYCFLVSVLHMILTWWSLLVYQQKYIFHHYYNNENRVNKLTRTCDFPTPFDRFSVSHQMAELYSAATCWWMTLCMLMSEPQVVRCRTNGHISWTISVFKGCDQCT